jgi:hypothetical protein
LLSNLDLNFDTQPQAAGGAGTRVALTPENFSLATARTTYNDADLISASNITFTLNYVNASQAAYWQPHTAVNFIIKY